jgi:hypothetical protein
MQSKVHLFRGKLRIYHHSTLSASLWQPTYVRDLDGGIDEQPQLGPDCNSAHTNWQHVT